MKVNNVIVYAIFALISVFLLWLWYFLGLNHVDAPLDLVLSILWWVLIVVGIIVLIRTERSRKRRIRTIYIAEEMIFNSEAGSFPYNNATELIEAIEKVLEDLKYNFNKEELPNENAFPIRYILRSKAFNSRKWKGEVVSVETQDEKSFDDKEELLAIIASFAPASPTAEVQDIPKEVESTVGADEAPQKTAPPPVKDEPTS